MWNLCLLTAFLQCFLLNCVQLIKVNVPASLQWPFCFSACILTGHSGLYLIMVRWNGCIRAWQTATSTDDLPPSLASTDKLWCSWIVGDMMMVDL